MKELLFFWLLFISLSCKPNHLLCMVLVQRICCYTKRLRNYHYKGTCHIRFGCCWSYLRFKPFSLRSHCFVCLPVFVLIVCHFTSFMKLTKQKNGNKYGSDTLYNVNIKIFTFKIALDQMKPFFSLILLTLVLACLCNFTVDAQHANKKRVGWGVC